MNQVGEDVHEQRSGDEGRVGMFKILPVDNELETHQAIPFP